MHEKNSKNKKSQEIHHDRKTINCEPPPIIDNNTTNNHSASTAVEDSSPLMHEASFDNSSAKSNKKIISNSFYNGNELKKHYGDIGELDLYDSLNSLPCKKSVFMNVYFRSPAGNLTEIDSVLVTSKAIFVIENKNHRGNVYGIAEYDEWIECYGNKKYKLYNPIMQNQAHVKALWNSIGAVLPDRKKEFIFSIIVFSDKCTLKVNSSDVPVLNSSKLLPYINNKLSWIVNSKLNNFFNVIHPVLNWC